MYKIYVNVRNITHRSRVQCAPGIMEKDLFYVLRSIDESFLDLIYFLKSLNITFINLIFRIFCQR